MEVELIEGIRCYAPEIAGANDFFPVEGFEKTKTSHVDSFWYRTRNRMFEYLLTQRIVGRSKRKARFLEIGCGSGAVLNHLSRLELPVDFTGLEGHIAGLLRARALVPQGVELVQANAMHLPFKEEFDFVGLFDVIEHLDDDGQALRSASKALAPGGLLFVSVPQHKFLWSEADENSGHRRRYSRKELRVLLEGSGFETLYLTSFLLTVFPFMVLSRLKMKIRQLLGRKRSEIAVEVNLPKILDAFLDRLTLCDEWLIRRGFSLPFGGTLMAVARKK